MLKNEAIICAICRHELPITRHIELDSNEISKKFYGRLDLVHGSALFYFHKKGITQELIHNLKYKNHQEIGTFLGEWYGEDLKPLHEKIKFDAIIPVPLHKKRLKERGYNQLTTFGHSLSKSLNIPYNEHILHRDVYAVTQTKKSFFERTDDKKTAFGADFTSVDHGKHFLLIDDVITTGATLEACGKLLAAIPNSKISIVTLAYSHS
ncbi:amidophosphoribosyltransferase [Flavobacterium orientale]|uniref:Amidophosphoribosyltransferase n=1 Tax=Flavobacterium orientale TaxID=1756020 RepID=A0A916XY88_9FLAO|nr:amidophosphoribosyltransferase [Flavobacterium orientale]